MSRDIIDHSAVTPIKGVGLMPAVAERAAVRSTLNSWAKSAVQRTSRWASLDRWAVPTAFGDAFAIAMYHGLSSAPLALPEPCILDEASFRRQMHYLAEHFTVVHVEDAVAVAASRPRKPVAAITFDDGFASVHDLAWPVLKELNLPATVYLVTGLIGTRSTVWFAALHHALATTPITAITVRGSEYPLGTTAERQQASGQIQRALKELPVHEFDCQLADVLDRLGADTTDFSGLDEFRMLSKPEVRAMASTGLVRFGGHTTNHRILTKVPTGDVAREMEESIAATARLTGQPSASFAYPNGGTQDFNDVAVEALRDAGIEWAVTTEPGPNRPTTDPYRLRRYMVGAGDSLDSFAWRMHHMSVRFQEIRRRIRGGRSDTKGSPTS